ncbi:putative ubiquitin-like modifier-activating enzyme ATG7-like [Apostichopus japonicus]|uniref:Putative ubiquitin-like modifier-activating enzyme ATG7-like n=1 Tax=Stichopus japonicus TaxID=307972 RepID=A0A2G8KYD6_STIJA|nr:putative ubiquitin-like modifier-activating enzyme ATG7-like [Apostichopus japonicus]
MNNTVATPIHIIINSYSIGDPDGVPCRLCVEYNAFEGPGHISSHLFPSPGTLINFNTLNAFREIDKKNVLEQSAKQIWDDIKSGKAITEPFLLSRFMLLTFCDLKKYHYHYWFAFPALVTPEPVTVHKPAQRITDVFTSNQVKSLQKEYDSLVKTVPHLGFFLVVQDGNSIKLQTLDKANKVSKKAKVFYGFCDPCTLSEHPGWPLRNYLALIASKWPSQEPISIICYRDRSREGQRSCDHSIVLEVNLPSMTDMKDCPKCVGWERNQKNKLGARTVDLSSSMDPNRLAESSVDLNLKLMRWRLIQELDLEKVQQTKCLLLGAERRETKAATAAEKLKKIFPGVTSSGHQFSIPMPGHAVGKSEAALKQVQEDVGKLEALIESHDVIYLLMDTRESRWLPTLIAASKRKLVVNAALGFDTYLVLRHGLKTDESEGSTASPVNLACIPGHRLGCYFCNDVVAPGNSTRDRTLDQQCTVSRPGLSMVAAALAVELMVSLLQHPNGGHAAADTSAKDDHLNASLISPLGLVPHQIRGFLARFHTILPASLAFNKCTACSESVMSGYREQGFNFLLKAFNQPSFLEDHSGLTTLHQEIDYSEIIAFSDDESVKSTE